MEKVIKLVNSPFTANIEVFDDLVLQIFAPCNETALTLTLNPNIHDFKAKDVNPGSQVRNFTFAVGPQQSYTFDFNTHKTLIVKFNGKRYELTLQRIDQVEIDGSKFYSYELFATSQPASQPQSSATHPSS